MRKFEELTHPNACMARAGENEMTFVLLGRDAAAPVAIRAWIEERIRLGKNAADDPQIIEAMECAATMEHEKDLHKPAPEAKETMMSETWEEQRERLELMAAGEHWCQLTKTDRAAIAEALRRADQNSDDLVRTAAVTADILRCERVAAPDCAESVVSDAAPSEPPPLTTAHIPQECEGVLFGYYIVCSCGYQTPAEHNLVDAWNAWGCHIVAEGQAQRPKPEPKPEPEPEPPLLTAAHIPREYEDASGYYIVCSCGYQALVPKLRADVLDAWLDHLAAERQARAEPEPEQVPDTTDHGAAIAEGQPTRVDLRAGLLAWIDVAESEGAQQTSAQELDHGAAIAEAVSAIMRSFRHGGNGHEAGLQLADAINAVLDEMRR